MLARAKENFASFKHTRELEIEDDQDRRFPFRIFGALRTQTDLRFRLAAAGGVGGLGGD
jgi:hypothetical protein